MTAPSDDYDMPWKSAIKAAAHLATGATRREPARRYAVKCELTELLCRRGWEAKRVLSVFDVIDSLLRLPPDLERQFKRFKADMEGRTLMPYVNSIVRITREDALAEGRLIGLQEGRLEGRLEGLRENFAWQLAMKFGTLSEELRAQVAVAGEEELKRWSVAVLTAATLGEVFSA